MSELLPKLCVLIGQCIVDITQFRYFDAHLSMFIDEIIEGSFIVVDDGNQPLIFFPESLNVFPKFF